MNANRHILFKAIVLTLCVIYFVHVFMFPLFDKNEGHGIVRSYTDLEQSLCLNNIKRQVSPKPARCPQYGIVTVAQGGRLGNQMWEYASAWAFARRSGLEPYVPRCIRVILDQVFEQLSVPTFEEISHCPLNVNNFVHSSDAWNLTTQSVILRKYAMEIELVLTWVQDVVKEFTFKRILLERSQAVLRLAARTLPSAKHHTFVGVHIRRTDYVRYLKSKYQEETADLNFYKAAMRIFESKYPNVVFVLVSDEPKWCFHQFFFKNNAYVTGIRQMNSPALDLAILASCNHTIMDYGTYGEWGALLAGGDTIYYNLSHHSTARLGTLLPNWYTIYDSKW